MGGSEGLPFLFAWYKVSQPAEAQSATLQVIATSQKGWEIYNAATEGTKDAVVTTLKDASDGKVNIGMPTAELNGTFSADGASLKQYYQEGDTTNFVDAHIDTHTAVIDFYLQNTNQNDAAAPTITISVIDDTLIEGSRTSDIKWILFEGTTVKSTSGYNYGGLGTGDSAKVLSTTSVSATDQNSVTFSSISHETRGTFHLYAWVEGTAVVETNYEDINAKIKINVA